MNTIEEILICMTLNSFSQSFPKMLKEQVEKHLLKAYYYSNNSQCMFNLKNVCVKNYSF